MDPDSQPSTGTLQPSGVPAPYGRSCAECAQSKCKCITRVNENTCERSVAPLRRISCTVRANASRCGRLGKNCRPSATVRRRNTPRKRNPSASSYASPPGSLNGSRSVTTFLNDCPPDPPALTRGLVAVEHTLSNVQAPFGHEASEPSPVEAEQYLSFFCTYKAKYFPFVYIPPTTTAQQLRQKKPFLWLCIMTIASRSTTQQQVLGSRIRDILAQEMMLKSGQNMDLLLGLLAYIAWWGALETPLAPA